MVMIPEIPIEEKILDAMEDGDIKQEKRGYLGYSGLGGNCKRNKQIIQTW